MSVPSGSIKHMNDLRLRSTAEAAASLRHFHEQTLTAEVGQALSIAALCDLHQVDDQALMDGVERWIDGGADGTPKIGEFIAGEIAGLLGISVGSAFDRIGDVLNLRHRHPTLWDEFLAGRIRWWQAVHVVNQAKTAQLDGAACARFDQMCAVALRVQSWQRARRNVARWLIRADPAKAEERRAAKARDRYAHVGKIEDGHTSLWGQLDAADGIALNQALDLVADALSDELTGTSKNGRRAAALGVLARTVLGQTTLPTATGAPRKAEVVVRIDAADLTDPATGVAEVDRWGVAIADQVRELLAGCQVTVRPIVFTDQVPAVDGYAIPDAMRAALVARNPVDVFPYGVKPAWGCDVDHTVPFDHQNKTGRGQTRLGNLGPLSRFTHRLKTFGGWRVTQPEPGVYHWRSPLGFEYVTTANGTVSVGQVPSATSRLLERWSARRHVGASASAGVGASSGAGELPVSARRRCRPDLVHASLIIGR